MLRNYLLPRCGTVLQILFGYEVRLIVVVCVKEDLKHWRSNKKYFHNASFLHDLKKLLLQQYP